MAQKIVQQQSLKQVQKLSPQQVQEVRMLEMNVEGLSHRIEDELMDNEALEKGTDENDLDAPDLNEEEGGDDFATSEDVLRDPEDDYDGDSLSSTTSDASGWQVRSESTFTDKLLEQLNEYPVSEDQHQLVEYLIGSLDDRGFLNKDLQSVVDELLLYQGVEASLAEVEEALKTLQQFDPAGVGARNLQECLLLQVDRMEFNALRQAEHCILTDYYDDMTNNRWSKISEALELDKEDLEAVKKDFSHLVLRPGDSMHVDGPNINAVIPDFILTVSDNDVQVQLNNVMIPPLHVSDSYTEVLQASKNQQLSKRDADQMAYIQSKVDSAQWFIQAIRQRNHTLLYTMRAIAERQKDYFLTGDESLLKPLAMKDVAPVAGVDISTVSRVCSSKYVQTPYGTFPLKHYFVERFIPRKDNAGDDDVSIREIKECLKGLLEEEDKSQPLSDQQMVDRLAEKGYTIARRTVAKYREQLGFPSARVRKEN